MKSLQEHLNNTNSINEGLSKDNLRKLKSSFKELNTALTNMIHLLSDMNGYDEDALNDLIAGKKYPFKNSLDDELLFMRRGLRQIDDLIK